MRELEAKGQIVLNGKTISLDDVSEVRPGDVFAVAIDTRVCRGAVDVARNAKLFLCESTYLEEHRDLAAKHHHLTAKQAAEIAKKAGAQQLILTHFSARYQDLDGFEKEAKAIFPNTSVADDLKVFPFLK